LSLFLRKSFHCGHRQQASRRAHCTSIVIPKSPMLSDIIFWHYYMLPILVHQSSRSARQIWIDDALNRRIESSWRASINSLNSLGGRLLYAGMLLILGPIVEYGGLEVAHLSMSAVLLITLSWYVIDYRLRQKKLS